MAVTGVFVAVTLALLCSLLENFYVTNKAAVTVCFLYLRTDVCWNIGAKTSGYLTVIWTHWSASAGMRCLAAAFFPLWVEERNHSTYKPMCTDPLPGIDPTG